MATTTTEAASGRILDEPFWSDRNNGQTTGANSQAGQGNKSAILH